MISKSRIFLPRSNLKIYLPNQLMLAASFFFAICYVAGKVISILFLFWGSAKMQASALSLVFKLPELIFLKAHNLINQWTQSTPRLEFTQAINPNIGHHWPWEHQIKHSKEHSNQVLCQEHSINTIICGTIWQQTKEKLQPKAPNHTTTRVC